MNGRLASMLRRGIVQTLRHLWYVCEELKSVADEQYPYLPAHITKPKEIKKLFLVHLPPKSNTHNIGLIAAD
jgi:hypothetical protein